MENEKRVICNDDCRDSGAAADRLTEWCWDWAGAYGSGIQTDPRGTSSGTNRVVHGGSWYYNDYSMGFTPQGNLTPSFRYHYLGFRLAAGE
ncbi:MAG: formylglycine-generating enzyme family protein [Treponema sp.]|nr:formylglycine-generating enzyme family protein [Treponema sp.]